MEQLLKIFGQLLELVKLMNDKLVNQSNFKNQIAYWINIPGDTPQKKKYSSIEILNGFFQGKHYEQHELVLKKVINDKVTNLILELPHYSGKTTACFLSSFIAAYSQGKNSLIIYPNKESCSAAERFINNQLESRLFHHFKIVKVLDEKTVLSRINRNCPKVYLTYISALHLNILPNLNIDNFWSQLTLVCLENLDLYQSTFGINSAFVFRRLRAKLIRFSAKYQLLVTTRPINNRTKAVEDFTGISSRDFQEIVNVNSAIQPERQIIQWFPSNRYLDTVKRTDYYDELNNLINSLIRADKNIAVVWDKYLVNPDDIANIGFLSEAPDSATSQLFIGNSVSEIRIRMLTTTQYDWENINIILIVGGTKQISYHINELKYCGINDHKVIFFDYLNPSLSWNIRKIIERKGKSLPVTNQQYSIMLSAPNFKIIEHHHSFLKEEYPEISTENLKMIFPGYQISKSEQRQSRYIFLNEDVQYLPRKSRKESDLYYLEEDNEFQLVLSSSSKLIGTISSRKALAFLYPSARFDFSGQHFKVESINYTERKAWLKHLDEVKIKTSKIASIEFTSDKNIGIPFRFGEGVDIEYQIGQMQLTILGVRSTQDYLTFDENIYPTGSSGYCESNIKSIFVSINPRYLFPEEFFNRDTESQEGIRQFIWKVRNLLHVLMHILLESAKTFVQLDPEEIAIQIITENDDQTEELITGVRIVDITGQNDYVFNLFREGSIRQLFTRAEEILLNCPCYHGCSICTSYDYCNLSHEGLEIDKLNVLKIICRVLQRSDSKIEEYYRWKSGSKAIDATTSGILRKDVNKLTSIVNFSWKIVDGRGFLEKFERYPIRFASDEELNNRLLLDNWADTKFGSKEIILRPGLPEYLLYFYIFREIFHNYLLENNHIHPTLKTFNWNDIDDSQNIPFMGRMVYDGFAVWFGIKMLEYFNSNFIDEIVQNVRNTYVISGTNTAFSIEMEKGYLGVLQALQEGFLINDYSNVFTSVIHGQKDHYLELSDNHGQIRDRLVCLRQKEKLGNIQRTSYAMATLDLGQNYPIFEARTLINKEFKKDIKHISWSKIQETALMGKEQYINNQEIRNILINKIGLIQGDTNILVCERCETPCNLFNAFMTSARLKDFIDLLIGLFPKPSKKR